MKSNIFKILLIFFVLINNAACSQTLLLKEDFDDGKKKDCNLLFIGNSFTFYNDGVDYHLKNMVQADVSDDSTNYDIQKIAVSSYTLEEHFQDALTLAKIKSKTWTTVVLQEQSTRPINNPALFLEFAGKLDAEIKSMGAKTALFMTWATKADPTDIDQLASAYVSTGKALNAQVVPVGKVWDYFAKNYPEINLYYTDNKHPALAGTYLIACVFYYSLLGKNPTLNGYVPIGLASSHAVTIRKAVFDSMQLTSI